METSSCRAVCSDMNRILKISLLTILYTVPVYVMALILVTIP